MTSPDRLWKRWVAASDSHALGRLFDAVSPGLRSMALHLAHDREAADDALQGTFLAALKNPQDLGQNGRVEAWLAGILIRQVRRQRRDRARDRSLSPSDSAAEAALAAASSGERSPAGQVAGREFESRVTSLIDGLPSAYAEPLRRRLLADESPQSIADDLDLSLGTVHKRLSRGLKKLRQALPAALAAPALGQTPAISPTVVRAHVLKVATGQQGAAAKASAAWTVRSFFLAALLPCLPVFAAWWALDASRNSADLDAQTLHSEVADGLGASAAPPVEEQLTALASAPSSGENRQEIAAAAKDDLRPILEFQVQGGDGVPLVGVRVKGYSMLEVDDDPERFVEFAAVTDALGRVRAPVLDGKYAFSANVPATGRPANDGFEDYSFVEGTVTVAGEHTEVVTLYPLSASLVVEALDDLQRPVEGIEFSVQGEFRTLVTDELGIIVFDRLHEGSYSVRVDRPEATFGQDRHLSLPENESQRVRLRTGEKASVRFVFQRTGSVRLSLGSPPRAAMEHSESIFGVISTLDGVPYSRRFELQFDGTTLVEDLPPGSYRVWFTFPSQSRLLFVNADVQVIVSAGEVFEHTIVLAAGSARIAGRVVDERGQAVPLVTLAAKRLSEEEGAPLLRSTRSDANGAFSIEGLTPDEYTVLPIVTGIQSGHFAWPSKGDSLRVTAPATDVEVLLKEAGFIDVRFPAGAHRYQVRIDRAGSLQEPKSYSLSHGAADIRHVGEGTYELTLWDGDQETGVRTTVKVHPGETAHVRWKMP